MGIAQLVGLFFVVTAYSEDRKLQPGDTFRDCADCPEMVEISAGTFLMGSSDADTARDIEAFGSSEERKYAQKILAYEHPQHPVNISTPFAMGKYPVTRGQFAAFVRDTGYSTGGGCIIYRSFSYPLLPEAGWQNAGFEQADRDPVVCVNWHDAKAYVSWLNRKVSESTSADGDGPYRLPSEAEWEYAARAGTQTARWWGDAIGAGNADCAGCGSAFDKQQPAPVGSFRANPFGLSDMLGSAWEWTEDCWNETYVGAPQDQKAWVTGKCEARVMRGGNWNTMSALLRSALRAREMLGDRTNYIGFRVAKALR
ncbi:formylglycine-generating enzyme family protein [Bradyrhizobium tropiciagri]|nr:formylglycine-generating enzyme family protein [Bradyrhizobium tropiciagri]